MKNEWIPSEYEECKTFKTWLDNQGLTYSHIPQETFTKSWGIKIKNREMGVHRGVPDYIIITPKGLLFIEMKRTKKGVISPEQKNWIKKLNEIDGVEATVCKGALEAKMFVSNFL